MTAPQTPISAQVKRCLELNTALADAVEHADIELPSGLPLSLQDQKNRFAVWCGNIGAHRTGTSSLEHRLRDASHIRENVVSLLDELESLTKDVRAIITGEMTPWDQMPEEDGESGGGEDMDEEDNMPGTEMEQIAMDIKEVVDSLLRLSITIRNPAPHDRFLMSGSTDTSYFEAFDIQHVRSKFGDASPWLPERLGKAISRRRQYFKYRQQHHDKLAHGLDCKDDNEGKAAPSTMASSIPDKLKKGNQGLFDDDNNSDADWKSQTSFATSVGDSEQLRVPSLPDEAEKGPFECPFCFMIVNITDTKSWKKHVFSDLRPYVCLESDCLNPDQEFGRRHEWLEHMRQNHWTRYACPLGCPNVSLTSVNQCKAHLESVHSGQVQEHQADALIKLHAEERTDTIDFSCSLCNQTFSSLKLFRRHVGRHQEQLSLFALPSINNGDGDGADEEVDHDSVSVGTAESAPSAEHNMKDIQRELRVLGDFLQQPDGAASEGHTDGNASVASDGVSESAILEEQRLQERTEMRQERERLRQRLERLMADEPEAPSSQDTWAADSTASAAQISTAANPGHGKHHQGQDIIVNLDEASQSLPKELNDALEEELRTFDRIKEDVKMDRTKELERRLNRLASALRSDAPGESDQWQPRVDEETSRIEDELRLQQLGQQSMTSPLQHEVPRRDKDEQKRIEIETTGNVGETVGSDSTRAREDEVLEDVQRYKKREAEHIATEATERQAQWTAAENGADRNENWEEMGENTHPTQRELTAVTEKRGLSAQSGENVEADLEARRRELQRAQEEARILLQRSMADTRRIAEEWYSVQGEAEEDEESRQIHLEAMRRAEEEASLRLEADIEARMRRRNEEWEERRRAEELARTRLEEALKAEAEAKAAAEIKAEAEAEAISAASERAPEHPQDGVLGSVVDEDFRHVTAKDLNDPDLTAPAEGPHQSKTHARSSSGDYYHYDDDEDLTINMRRRTADGAKDKAEDDAPDTESPGSKRPTYTRMARRHLSIETLNAYNVNYILDDDPSYILIKRWVPEAEQDKLWAHTSDLRSRRAAAEGKAKGQDKAEDDVPGTESSGSKRPTYTRMARRHLSIETLNAYNVKYILDDDPSYVLVKRWVPEAEQDKLWAHTRDLRSRRAAAGRREELSATEKEPSLFEYLRNKTPSRRGRDRSPSLLEFLATGRLDTPDESNSVERVISNNEMEDSLLPTNPRTPEPQIPPEGPVDSSKQEDSIFFRCTLCPERFTRAHQLRAHLKTHLTEKPFLCSECGLPFERDDDRKRHERVHGL